MVAARPVPGARTARTGRPPAPAGTARAAGPAGVIGWAAAEFRDHPPRHPASWAGRSSRSADLHHVLARHDLRPLAAARLAEAALVLVEREPAAPGRVRHAPALQQRLDLRRIAAGRPGQLRGVGQQARDGLRRAALVCPISPTGPRLIQPTA